MYGLCDRAQIRRTNNRSRIKGRGRLGENGWIMIGIGIWVWLPTHWKVWSKLVQVRC